MKYEILSFFKLLNVPETVSIEVTRKYNKNCLNKNLPDPNINDLKCYIDQAIKMGCSVFVITEGETLFCNNIYELIRYINKKKAIVNLFTWGLNFSEEKARKLKDAGLQTLLISLYSTNPLIHDKIRGIDKSYYKVINAIKIAKKVGLLVTITTHINKKNCSLNLDSLFDLSCKLNVNEFSIWEELPTENNNYPNNKYSKSQILQFQKYKNNINKYNKNIPKVFTNIYFEKKVGILTGNKWLHIDVDGNVHPDPYISKSYGNIKKITLINCWKNIRNDKVLLSCISKKIHPLYCKEYINKYNIFKKKE